MCRLGSTAARLKLKGIDGDLHKRWSMWFNSTLNEEPYPGLTCSCIYQRWYSLRGCCTGAAWLSSARVVRCWVKSRNERNPYSMLLIPQGMHSSRTAFDKKEEGGDDVKSSCPLCLGLHTCYNGWDNAMQARKGERTAKPSLSSDRRLQLACVKSESLVNANQHVALNTFPGLVHTARHVMGAGHARSR